MGTLQLLPSLLAFASWAWDYLSTHHPDLTNGTDR